MNKPLLGSLVAATLLLGDASAATMYERFDAMEKEMKRLQSELANMKAEKAAAEAEEAEEAEEDEEEEEEEEADYSEDDADDEEEIDVNEMLEDHEEAIHDLTRATSGNHVKMSVDFRTSYDSVNYKMRNGESHENNDILTNRLWLNMNWAANENMSFTGQLAYNKMYGQRFGINQNANPLQEGSAFEDFDWVSSTNPSADGTIRVKSAYYFYRNDTFLGTDIPWTFSLGRRPSTNGHLINLREDDTAASPSGHTINVEFDGVSAKFGLEKLTGVEGMYIKLCGGQGATNADAKFTPTPYAFDDSNDLPNIHMAGFIFVPYDNGQFSIGTQFTGASNLIDINDPNNPTGIEDYGDLYTGSMYAMLNGIGDEWSDFLDDTTFFVSGAMTRTNPDEGKMMLGSPDMENGYSYWVGLNMPSLVTEEGRFGLEFNHGSKYWRPITYGEDTLIGSKVAARGNVYEAYFTEPLLEDVFSLQIRYTYIDYDYTGSNGFFGNATGTPVDISKIPKNSAMAASVVDEAQDLRVYLRYRY